VISLDLCQRQGDFQLQVALQLPSQGVTVVLGPSGCGKTTLLRAAAGLVRAQGSVRLPGDDVWQDDAARVWRPVHQRPVGLVFQEASLFPHLSVRDNLLFGHRRVPVAQRQVVLDEVVALLGIAPLLARRPENLSGGERQRVAIGRALLTSPRWLLMDEPLSALDAARKAELLPYLEALGRRGVPILYVTHALDEAVRLADHLVLMQEGAVQLSGAAQDVLNRPDTPLARLDEASALVQGLVLAHDEVHGLSQLGWGPEGRSGHLWIGHCRVPVGTTVRVRVLARDVSLSLSRATDSSILNIVPAIVQQRVDESGGSVLLQMALATSDQVAADAPQVLARLTRRSVEALALQPGAAVWAQIKGAALMG
jgi:molybdate transport system ATP-binding protein